MSIPRHRVLTYTYSVLKGGWFLSLAQPRKASGDVSLKNLGTFLTHVLLTFSFV